MQDVGTRRMTDQIVSGSHTQAMALSGGGSPQTAGFGDMLAQQLNSAPGAAPTPGGTMMPLPVPLPGTGPAQDAQAPKPGDPVPPVDLAGVPAPLPQRLRTAIAPAMPEQGKDATADAVPAALALWGGPPVALAPPPPLPAQIAASVPTVPAQAAPADPASPPPAATPQDAPAPPSLGARTASTRAVRDETVPGVATPPTAVAIQEATNGKLPGPVAADAPFMQAMAAPLVTASATPQFPAALLASDAPSRTIGAAKSVEIEAPGPATHALPEVLTPSPTADGPPLRATGHDGRAADTQVPIASPQQAPTTSAGKTEHAPEAGIANRPVADPMSPGTQVAQVVIRLAETPGGGRLIIQLTPEHLGRVEVQIDRTAAGVAHISLTAARPDTLALIQQDHAQLFAALDRGGVSESGRTISFHSAPEAKAAHDPQIPTADQVAPATPPAGSTDSQARGDTAQRGPSTPGFDASSDRPDPRRSGPAVPLPRAAVAGDALEAPDPKSQQYAGSQFLWNARLNITA